LIPRRKTTRAIVTEENLNSVPCSDSSQDAWATARM
jgi:hypothetical protein